MSQQIKSGEVYIFTLLQSLLNILSFILISGDIGSNIVFTQSSLDIHHPFKYIFIPPITPNTRDSAHIYGGKGNASFSNPFWFTSYVDFIYIAYKNNI